MKIAAWTIQMPRTSLKLSHRICHGEKRHFPKKMENLTALTTFEQKAKK